MKLTRWVASCIPSDTRIGHRLRRGYRRVRPASINEWQHEVLDGFERSVTGVRFVQIGSNDSGYGDPLRYYILHRGWRGLLIEPLPYIYERLIRRYPGMSELQYANVAIGQDAGEKQFYHLRPSDEPGLPPWYDMLGSFSESHVLGHTKYLADIPQRIVSTPVQCATLDQVCAEHGITQFDVLHIDAEGHDFDVLNSVDLSAYGVRVVLFENRHLSEAHYATALEQLHAADLLTHSDQFDTIGVSRRDVQTGPALGRVWQRMRRHHGVSATAWHSGEREAEATR